jgi:hypothetical protein
MRAVLGRYRRVPVWPFSSDCSFRGARQHDLFRPSLNGMPKNGALIAVLIVERQLCVDCIAEKCGINHGDVEPLVARIGTTISRGLN